MSKVLYIDFENVQSIDLPRVGLQDFTIWVFTGVSQSKIPIELARITQPFGDKLHWLSITGSGPNALDFHIAYYLGIHTAANPKDDYYILSKDKGFDPLIKHVSAKGTTCKRITGLSEIVPSTRASTKPKRTAESDGSYAKVMKNLTKIEETKRPRNRRTLRQHLRALLGKAITDQGLDQIIEQIIASGHMVEANGKLTYHL
jgi:PIN domain